MEEVELLEGNPNFSKVRFPNGRESNVSISDIAPCPRVVNKNTDQSSVTSPPQEQVENSSSVPSESFQDTFRKDEETIPLSGESLQIEKSSSFEPHSLSADVSSGNQSTFTENSSTLRRSGRVRRPPQRYGDNVYDK